MNKFILIGLLCVGTAGCAYPNPTVEQGAAPSHIRVSDAPKGTTILIDGRAVGVRSAERTDSFNVEPGAHVVEEQLDGRTLLRKSYSIDAGATVDIRGN